MEWRDSMKRPTKMKFYRYMKEKYGKDFTDKDKISAFTTLIDVIQECKTDENINQLKVRFQSRHPDALSRNDEEKNEGEYL